MAKRRFFEEQEPRSIIKSQIVAKYFKAWSNIMLSKAPAGSRIVYADLFSGPGRFEDGRPSTPILVLEHAIATPALHGRLSTLFNDADPERIEQLRAEIEALPGIEKLKIPPQLSVSAVGTNMAEMLGKLTLVPTLFFVDPFGYKGLSLELFGSAIKSWGCECIFFFNYNRINPALGNSIVDPLINELFGAERAASLRKKVRGEVPEVRQTIIINELSEALADVAGQYSLMFEFESDKGKRPSHYIVFVTKQFRGYDIMKEIMVGLSSDNGDVKELRYVPVRSAQPNQMRLFDSEDARKPSLSALKAHVASTCAGQSLTVEQAYMRTTVGTPYTSRNVKDAIRSLEASGQVTVDIPAEKRKKCKGLVTLSDKRIVTFPLQKGQSDGTELDHRVD